MITTMTKEEFFAAWRAECREWFEIEAALMRVVDRLPYDRRGEGATSVQRQRHGGQLLLDRLRAKTLVVEGWVDPNGINR